MIGVEMIEGFTAAGHSTNQIDYDFDPKIQTSALNPCECLLLVPKTPSRHKLMLMRIENKKTNTPKDLVSGHKTL